MSRTSPPTSPRNPTSLRRGIGSMATVLFLAGILLPSTGAATHTALAPATSGSPQQWAYGGQEWLNATILTTNGTYTTRAFYGWQVITTATNTSKNTTMVEASDAWAYSYYMQYCVPNCASASVWQNVSVTEWELATAFVNLTNAASVTENGHAVPAFGITNASAAVTSNVSESWKLIEHTKTLYSGVYFAAGTASDALRFTPALGLIPLSAAKNQTWTATSAFSATGGWRSSSYYSNTATSASGSTRANASGIAAATGNETVYGTDLGTVTLANGAKVSQIDLSYSGPYSISGGLFLIPTNATLFGGANQAWNVNVLAPAAVSSSVIDVAVSGSSNTPSIIAASSTWQETGRTLGNTSSTPSAASGGVAPAAQSGTLQAQPEPVPVAQARSQCLVTTCTSSPSPAAVGFPMWPFAVGGAGVLAALGFLLVKRRRGRAPASVVPEPSQAPGRSRFEGRSAMRSRRPPVHRVRATRGGPEL